MDLIDREMRTTRVMMILAVVVLFISGLGGEHSVLDYFELQDSKEVLERSMSSMRAEIKLLEKEIEKIKESPDYARRVLRDQFHLTDKDESIVFFPD